MPAHVVVAVGTGGTAAGLALGFQLAGLRTRVLGVVVNDQLRLDPPVLARLARRSAKLLERRGADLGPLRLDPGMLDLTRDQIGAGYGHPTEAAGQAAALAAEDGLALDPVYTAKAMAGLLALRAEGRLADPVLFVHTDGPRPGPCISEELDNLAHLRRARDRIDREYARPLDVEALARTALMSSAHFSRQFRAAYGETPYGYLMTRRIERAQALLRHGDMSVTEACMAVGCTSLGSFSSRFTELVGETPSAYRARDHGALAEVPGCIAKDLTRPSRKPSRNGETTGSATP